MPYADPVIPALPVLAPLVLLALVASGCLLHRRGALTAPRLGLAAVVAGYGAVVLRATLLPLPLNGGAVANLVPWWAYVQPVPLLTADPVGVALNVALFVPLGLLLPLVAPRVSVRGVALVGFAVSFAVESTQLLLDATVSYGRVFDVDDLVANTAGAVLGVLLLRLLAADPTVRDLVRAVSWPCPAEVYRPVYPAASVVACPPSPTTSDRPVRPG